MGEHVEHVVIRDIDILPVERLVPVPNEAIRSGLPVGSQRTEAHECLHLGEILREHGAKLRRRECEATRAVLGRELGGDAIDAFGLEVMPVVGQLAAQIQPEHRARGHGKRKPGDVDERIKLVSGDPEQQSS